MAAEYNYNHQEKDSDNYREKDSNSISFSDGCRVPSSEDWNGRAT